MPLGTYWRALAFSWRSLEGLVGPLGAILEAIVQTRGKLQLFTLRESPPAHSGALPMSAGGKWKDETHMVKQGGQGEEGMEGVGPSWRLSWSIGGLLGAMGLFWGVLGSPKVT